MFDDDQIRTINTIDRSSPLPLHYQLKRILLRHIQDGDLIPGKTIPSETELQERYGVSRITVRRALSDLVLEQIDYDEIIELTRELAKFGSFSDYEEPVRTTNRNAGDPTVTTHDDIGFRCAR